MDLLIKEGDLNGNFNSVEMRDEVSFMMAAVRNIFLLKDVSIDAICNHIQGHDTTALAFTWFLYLISRHPDKQVRIP